MVPPCLNKEKAKVILLELHELFNTLRLPFFLIEGTCLGAYRDKDFCNGDKDIDIGLKHEKLCPAIDTLINMLEKLSYSIKIETTPYKYARALHLVKNGVRVDVMDYALNGEERFCANGRRDYCIVHDAGLFESMCEIEFLGEKFNIPTPVEIYLEREYGPNWRIPDPLFCVSQTRIYEYWSKNVVK